MIPIVLDIPEEEDRLFEWLDCVLVGPRLRELVYELSQAETAVNDDFDLDAVRTWAGEHLETLLSQGTSGLGDEKVHELLKRPRLLRELQHLVLLDGGAYWHKKIESHPDIQSRVTALREEVLETARPLPQPSKGRQRKYVYAYAPVGITIAVVLCVLVFSNKPVEKPSVINDLNVPQLRGGDSRAQPKEQLDGEKSWGWNKVDLFDEGLSTEDYPRVLADSLNEWFDPNIRPKTLSDLRFRLSEIWMGCDTVSKKVVAELNEANAKNIKLLTDYLVVKILAIIDQINEGTTELETENSKLKKLTQLADESIESTIDRLRAIQ